MPINEQEYKRKLAAILSADVKGYSRLMREDETATVHTLKGSREIMAELIQQYRGRVVDSPGDNLLAEFASVVDAVKCAVKLQEELRTRNDELPQNRRMEFRIGINLGDVIEEEDRIYGDGVNIAARVENLAEGGGICISGTVYEHVKDKLPLGYEYLGEHIVKNIPEPVRVYRVLKEPEAAGKIIGVKRARLRRWQWIAAFGAIVIAIGLGAIWNFYFRSAPSEEKVASITKPAIPLAERASIAVLPFKNLSADQEQEYFSDGITNDIITDLSKFREMLVIASNTVFTYKNKPTKIEEVGQQLGVRYVLEGSVQKASEKVRVNAQLIDATKGHHLWAERYDKGLKDLFAVQDEIVRTIVATLAIKVEEVERERAMRKDTDNLEAYDYVLRGREYFSRTTRSANIQARQLFQKAIELDPRYALAYVGLGRTYLNQFRYGWSEFPGQALQQVYDLAQKALSLEESAAAHALLGLVYRYRKQYDLATKELERALQLNPNDADSHMNRGAIMNYLSRPDEAIDALETAMHFNPNMLPPHYMQLGFAYYLKQRYDDAIVMLEKGLGKYPDHVFLHIVLAAAYAQAGRSQDAAREAKKVLRLHPFFEVDSYGTAFHNDTAREHIRYGLRKAGLK
jgi:adenylate cyclase